MLQAFKVTRQDGLVYYAFAMYPWHLTGRLADSLQVEQVEQTPYVVAACRFYGGVTQPFRVPEETREAIIQRMAAGDCLWHACAMVTGGHCYCATCARGRS